MVIKGCGKQIRESGALMTINSFFLFTKTGRRKRLKVITVKSTFGYETKFKSVIAVVVGLTAAPYDILTL